MRTFFPIILLVLFILGCNASNEKEQPSTNQDSIQTPVRVSGEEVDDHEKLKNSSGITGQEQEDKNSGSWSITHREAFMIRCLAYAKEAGLEQTARPACNCVLDKLEQQYASPSEIDTISQVEIAALALACK